MYHMKCVGSVLLVTSWHQQQICAIGSIFGVGSIQLSFRIYHCVQQIYAKMFSIRMSLHFSRIVPRVCTLVLFIIILMLYTRYKRIIIIIGEWENNGN